MRRIFLPLIACVVATTASATTQAGGPKSAHYADSSEGIFWFFHISDLHINDSTGPAAAALKAALNVAVKDIQPSFVLATGNLVDGSSVLNVPCSGQSQQEWDAYKTLWTDAGMKPDFYFNLPGNHDSYGDQGLTHYLSNSLQGKTTDKLQADWTVTTSLGTYYFAGLNSAGTFGKPLTWGNPEFTSDELAALETSLQQHAADELIFVAAHHPLSAYKPIDWQHQMGLTGKDPLPIAVDQVKTLLKTHGGFYLHGHIHETKEYLDGDGEIVVNQIDGLGKSTTGNIGIVAIDHNAVTYKATGSEKPSPFVMITAPVDHYLNGGGKKPDDIAYGTEPDPFAYPVCKDRKNNPVRALVFSQSPASSVELRIDGSKVTTMKPNPTSPSVYLGHIDTTTLSAAMHKIEVVAKAGSDEASDGVQVEFTKGPCPELPGQAAVGGAAGAPADAGQSDTGSAGASAAGTGGSSAVDAAVLDSGLAGSTGSQVQAATDESGSTGGCNMGRTGRSLGWAGLLGVALLCIQRRSERVELG